MSRSPTVTTPAPVSAFAVFFGRRRDRGMSSALTADTRRRGSVRSVHHPRSPGRSMRRRHAWRAAGAPSRPCRGRHHRERRAVATTALPHARPQPGPRRFLRDPRPAVAGRSSTSTARHGRRHAASARASEPPRGPLAAGQKAGHMRGRPRGLRDHHCWLPAGSRALRAPEREGQRQRYRLVRRWPRRRAQRASRRYANWPPRRYRQHHPSSG